MSDLISKRVAIDVLDKIAKRKGEKNEHTN